jgi:hypothetical protein
MSYYINSATGRIYFNSHKKLSVLMTQNNHTIRRSNIFFHDENTFYKFSDFYQWLSMVIIYMNNQYYLSIWLNNDTYEILDIYYDNNYFTHDIKNDLVF